MQSGVVAESAYTKNNRQRIIIHIPRVCFACDIKLCYTISTSRRMVGPICKKYMRIFCALARKKYGLLSIFVLCLILFCGVTGMDGCYRYRIVCESFLSMLIAYALVCIGNKKGLISHEDTSALIPVHGFPNTDDIIEDA